MKFSREVSMKNVLIGIIALTLLGAGIAGADWMEKIKDLTGKKDKPASGSAPAQGGGQGSGLDKDTVAAGLKEALSLGSQNAVKAVSQADGYFKNPSIKIPLPEKIQKVENRFASLA
jgi:hypothetical protein